MKTTLKYFAILCAFVTIAMACSKDKNTQAPGMATMQVRMTDAPGDYEAVFIDVKDVMISSSDADGGWVSLPGIRPGVYDLLELNNGLDTLLAIGLIPAGKINQIRLILGDGNFVRIDGVLYPLETPSAQQSGLKIKFNTDVVAGATYLVILDFDAGKSIVSTGSGKYNLKPVIRAFVQAGVGAIAGITSPAVDASIVAINGVDTVGTFTTDDGKFKIVGLTPGVYTVVISPSTASGYDEKIITNVVVSAGVVTGLGTISL